MLSEERIKSVLVPLPCPFCGSEPFVEEVSHNSVKKDSWMILGCKNPKCQIVLSGDFSSRDKAIKAWNTRTGLTAQEIVKLIEEEAALHVGNVQNNGKRDSGVYEQGIGMEKIVMLIKANMQG